MTAETTVPYVFRVGAGARIRSGLTPIKRLVSVRASIYTVLAGCVAIQCFLDASIENIACAVLVFCVSALTVRLLVVRSVIIAVPLAVVSVLGFNVATMSGALLVQTLSLRPLIFNLHVPEVTFASCGGFQVSLLVALFILRHCRMPKQIAGLVNRRVMKPLGLMNMPSQAQLWIMGIVGCAALAWTATVMYTGAVQYGDVGSKLAFGFIFLAYAPYLIPLRGVFGASKQKTGGKQIALLGLYTVLLIVIGILRNSRGAFAVGVSNLGLSLLLAAAVGQIQVSKKAKQRIIGLASAVLIASPILSDLSTAMIIVRSQRSAISSTQLLSDTLNTFQNKDELERFRQTVTTFVSGASYDETYISNPFAARFVVTKFFDNTLSYDWIWNGSYRSQIWRVTSDKMVALIPSPLLAIVGVGKIKGDLEFSIGDYLYYLRSGIGLGGYRTGSPLGHGVALFGGLVFLAVVPIYLIGFILTNAMTLRTDAGIRISPLILMQMMTVYFLASGDSLLVPMEYMLRGLPQSAAIYMAVLWIARLFTSVRIS